MLNSIHVREGRECADGEYDGSEYEGRYEGRQDESRAGENREYERYVRHLRIGYECGQSPPDSYRCGSPFSSSDRVIPSIPRHYDQGYAIEENEHEHEQRGSRGEVKMVNETKMNELIVTDLYTFPTEDGDGGEGGEREERGEDENQWHSTSPSANDELERIAELRRARTWIVALCCTLATVVLCAVILNQSFHLIPAFATVEPYQLLFNASDIMQPSSNEAFDILSTFNSSYIVWTEVNIFLGNDTDRALAGLELEHPVGSQVYFYWNPDTGTREDTTNGFQLFVTTFAICVGVSALVVYSIPRLWMLLEERRLRRAATIATLVASINDLDAQSDHGDRNEDGRDFPVPWGLMGFPHPTSILPSLSPPPLLSPSYSPNNFAPHRDISSGENWTPEEVEFIRVR